MELQVNRILPNLPVGSYKTYQLSAPRGTHWRPSTCDEADCEFYVNGWSTAIDESTELGKGQAYYIRNQSGRRFTEDRHGSLTTFRFEAGQTCFAEHEARLDRPELYIVRGGDWRGNPTGEVRQHTRASDWVDDFADHQQTLADRINQG
jgi:hypothetical protein